MPELDVVIPAHNESDNIIELLVRLERALDNAGIDYNIIVVDDHSTDGTDKKVREYKEKYSRSSIIYASSIGDAQSGEKVTLLHKKGTQGKATAILEGAREGHSPYVAMIDGDLQYSPEVVPQMFKLAKRNGVAVANRKKNGTRFLRKMGSKVNRLIFERMLHGFKCDTQSGLKVFRKEIIEHISEKDVTPWTLDMLLLKTGIELGFKIATYDIEFTKRKKGASKIHFFKAGVEIAKASVSLKLKKPRVYQIQPTGKVYPVGAGVAYKGKRFITHTLLSHHLSAVHTLNSWQKLAFVFGILLLTVLFYLNLKATAIALVALLSLIYFIDLIFTLKILLKSLHFPPEIQVSDEELKALDEKNLPTYSILCPLYKESEVLPQFIDALSDLDWPKSKLDVLLLLEEDDEDTITAANSLSLPEYVRVLIVPHSLPKTKPKACNYGLAHAKGEYLVVYDAEDRPESTQLKKAFLGFKKSDPNVVCLQSKLNYYNPNHNLLTRLFTAEYSLWFDLVLPGLQSIESVIPLGGTSNHFRMQKLRELNGWDSFNVTEDCDLGARLFKKGYKTALIDSTTYEEANSRLKSWIKQRSRWIKGYIQTYLVHMRDPLKFHREFGFQALIFQLVVGMRMIFILINPVLWAATISYFTMYKFVGPQIEALYPTPVFYIAVISLVFGNFVYFYNYMIGCAKRGQWYLIKYVFLVPFYWLATSFAAVVAFYQLFVKPHYWEKTQHGFHLDKNKKIQEEPARILPRINLSSDFVGAGILIAANVLANFSNFGYNAYLGREVAIEEFGTVSLISNIFTLLGVLTGAFGKTVTYKTAYLLGKFKFPISDFLDKVEKKSFFTSILLTLIWTSLIPLMSFYFKSSILPFVIFTPALFISFVSSTYSGYLSGNLLFTTIAALTVFESLVKLVAAVIFVKVGLPELVYASIPISLFLSFLISWFAIGRIKKAELPLKLSFNLSFPKGFYITSILTKLSSVAFLSFDIVLAKLYLEPKAAGEYALLSLSGKIIYFLGVLFSQFIVPVISKTEGAQKNSKFVFYKLLGISTLASLAGFVAIGVFGKFTIPYLFGEKSLGITQYLLLYSYAIFSFSVASSVIIYHQIKRHYLFPIIGVLVAFYQVYLISLNHESVSDITVAVATSSLVQFFLVGFAHIFYRHLHTLYVNFKDFRYLFAPLQIAKASEGRLNILVFNWRDLKHVWGGGAEVYVEEIAKRWVKEGHAVTLFCGNDGKNKMNEKISGIQIIRRGGFYTIYIWALLYYLLKFRGKFDVVVDSENGIPFFTPLYVSVPVVLLIHHVHQDYLREQAPFPISHISKLLESRLMPYVYKGSEIATVSESSKKDIVSLGFKKKHIEVINPGINIRDYKKLKKTQSPTFIYVGRLKPYKNVDVAIKAIALLKDKYSQIKLIIAGKGESEKYLRTLAQKLGASDHVEFHGFVTDQQRVTLFAQSWAAIQPSSFEGWGITVIEANASGTPVIASKIKGLSDSVVDGRTGLLVPPCDEKILAKVMGELIKFEDFRHEISENAYEWSKNFSWDKSSKEFLKVIFRTLETKRDIVFVRKPALTESD